MTLSKNIRVAVAVLATLSAVFAAVFAASADPSERKGLPGHVDRRFTDRTSDISLTQRPSVGATAARNAALIAATQEVLKETSELRQLSILRPVQSSTQSRTEIESMIVKNLEADTAPMEIHAAEVSFKKLGLAPPEFEYRPFMIRLLTEQVAGYYDPRLHEFHLADWIDVDGQRPVMAHELTHALQDQHFNLRRFEHWPKGDSDAQLAAHALVEGDATLVMALYVANNPLRALAFLRSLSASGMSSKELAGAPRFLRETLLFPYQEGTAWTRTLYKQGGWEEVSKAFTELPQSTEQILHPEKYFAHEAPVKVTLPDIAVLLNAGDRRGGVGVSDADSSLMTRPSSLSLPASDPRLPAPAAWRRIDYDVEGEWGFYLILDQFLKSPIESRRAADGWGGDRYEVYEGPNGQALFVSLSAWDTENDAHEFFDAYAKRTQLRYPNVEKLSSDQESSNSRVQFATWKTSEGAIALNLRGARVLIIEASTNVRDLNSLMRALTE